MFSDASVSAEGVAGAWYGRVEVEGGWSTCIEGSDLLAVEAKTDVAECMALIEAMTAALAHVEAGKDLENLVLVFNSDSEHVTSALAGELVPAPLRTWLPIVREIQTLIEAHRVEVLYVWTRRASPQIQIVDKMCREAWTPRRKRRSSRYP